MTFFAVPQAWRTVFGGGDNGYGILFMVLSFLIRGDQGKNIPQLHGTAQKMQKALSVNESKALSRLAYAVGMHGRHYEYIKTGSFFSEGQRSARNARGNGVYPVQY